MSSDGGPVRLSRIVGSPTFRSAAINAVSVIPLLSTSNDGRDDPTTHSSQSFHDFLSTLHRHNANNANHQGNVNRSSNAANTNGDNSSNVVVVVPNSNLTRPSDWKYNETPLRNFHWGHGCQRLRFFDGRPYHSRSAHDRLINHELTRNWIDLCPSRRTAALIGVLNVRDCPDQATLETAIQEWRQWAERYSTPPYEVTAHGRDVGRDTVVPRLFVFDSFHEDFVNNPGVNLQEATDKLKVTNNCLVAFPPSDQERSEMMDLHVNVVVNDLAVAVFRELEGKIRESDSLVMSKGGVPTGGGNPQTPAKTGFFGRSNSKVIDEESPMGSRKLSIDNLATVVSPNSELASSKPTRNSSADNTSSSQTGKVTVPSMNSSVMAQLLTPLDELFEYTELSPKDAHMMMKRQIARREKFTADICLLAGSPLDAYDRYTKAANLCKTSSPDPLWYASALEGCASVHIAMADVGGFNVDEYLESSFQLPEELMACALVSGSDAKSNNNNSEDGKKSMPKVILALCEDALNVTSRHPKTAGFHSELLLKLAWYTAEVEDVHLRCQWGLGGDDETQGGEEYCYSGDPNNDKRRWEMSAATRLNFLDLKNKDGENVIMMSTMKRCQKCSEFMHRAVASSALDPVTRADIALRCLSISWRGVRPTAKPTARERRTDRVQLKRKAAFFAATAAEAMSDVSDPILSERANAMWMQVSRLLSMNANSSDLTGGNYGWATLRAVALHALVIQGTQESSEEAAKQLLMLMSEISPPNRPVVQAQRRQTNGENFTKADDSSGRSLSFAGARSYIRDSAKEVRSLFGNDMSSLLVVQSKWVEDDPMEPVHLPMGYFSSDFANRVLELPSVWSTIRFEHCSVAQERLVGQINGIRKKIPVSTLQNSTKFSQKNKQKLPIEIVSLIVVSPESSLKLERVKLKRKPEVQDTNNAMATFFNPYAKQAKKVDPTTVPQGEEQYVSVAFSNKLSIPFHVDSSKLEFDTPNSGNIKAPSISFVIPGQTKNYAVRFPFLVLVKLNEDDIDTLEVKGIHITALSRAIFLPVGAPKEEDNDSVGEEEDSVIPKSSSLYPRRDYSKTSRSEDQKSKIIQSPQLEITPPQPNLRVSFASCSTPMDKESIIPVLLADGEIFTLPKICVSNDTGFGGLGTIEELQISAIGLPGTSSDVVVYDMSGKEETEKVSSTQQEDPISISATCVGMDAVTLNSSPQNSMNSFLAAKLHASPNMGAKTHGCDVVLRFRYRGKAVSPSLEVWRKYEIEIKILRVKGPRIPSLSFRCDLSWESGYSDLCHALAAQEAYSSKKAKQVGSYDIDISGADEKDFAANRLGQDPGVHVCSEKVAVMLSVANESAAPIILSRVDDSPFGFPSSQMYTLKVSKGVSAKFPIVLPRIDRSSDVCKELIKMTKLKWRSDIEGSHPDDAQETGGPMYPVNRRARQGFLELPVSCLKTIIKENSIFLSRICKAPCAISVETIGVSSVQKPVDVSVTVQMADWVSSDLIKGTRCVLSFFCANQNSDLDKENQSLAVSDGTTNKSKKNAFVWIGQTRKNLRFGDTVALETEERASVDHQAKILFLEGGDYFVSACLSLSEETDEENGIKEVWWSDKAAKIHVSRSTTKATAKMSE